MGCRAGSLSNRRGRRSHLSFAYYSEGLARLRHDDFAGGVRQLGTAPPSLAGLGRSVEGIGRRQCRRGQRREALRYYDQALRVRSRVDGTAESPQCGGEEPSRSGEDLKT